MNYQQLNELYTKHRAAGLRILAFPCNQFAGQEPAGTIELQQFMEKMNVQFDVYAKVEVNGDNAHPVWKFLKSVRGGLLGDVIKWNFTKFLLDKEGKPVKRYAPTTEPNVSV